MRPWLPDLVGGNRLPGSTVLDGLREAAAEQPGYKEAAIVVYGLLPASVDGGNPAKVNRAERRRNRYDRHGRKVGSGFRGPLLGREVTDGLTYNGEESHGEADEGTADT